MLLTEPVARAIAEGSISVVFRRWARPRVKAGGTFRSSAGVIKVVSIDEVGEVTAADAQRAGASSVTEVLVALGGHANDPLFRIGVEWAGADRRIELAADATLSASDVAAIAETLAGVDRRGRNAPWTHDVLHRIRERPRIPADRLRGDLELLAFKRRVRRLKELGLTRSLEVGYEISPRGMAYLRAVDAQEMTNREISPLDN
ncbi:hypothetical protein [Agromyces subbeticus]|uniref:hypothetical protein n=1 Tax=Agromyces subbeticus TaxID=293890 RepID=UPI0003B4AC78|nr:hypothetical protein [Agromyces subbeticus]